MSIVVATRDRAEKLGRLLRCIQAQDFADFECIVVDDASSPETLAAYEALWQVLDGRFSLHRRPKTGGPSQSRNTGIDLAQGVYIAFCDDDDYWTRTDHLTVAARALQGSGADLYFSNMQTSVDGQIANPDWYAELRNGLRTPVLAGESDVYTLTQQDVGGFLSHRILHANTLVVSRALLMQIGCYWEKISFAEDHDLSYRLADAAAHPLFRTTVTADLDVSTHASIARTYGDQERLLFSVLAILHAESVIRNPALRKIARGNRAWRLLDLATATLKDGNPVRAREFALEAMLIRPSKRSLSVLLTVLWQQAKHPKQRAA